MIVIATYKVKKENFNDFLRLMNECEMCMRKENLITSKPIYRMQSVINEEFLVEIFEWQNKNSFQEAQNNISILNIWKLYEEKWVKGGFGINEIPESNNSWAQFKSI